MKWLLHGRATLYMHINVKRLKIYYLSNRLIKNQMRKRGEDKYEEAITQKPTCNEAIEHLNALRCFVESISDMLQQIRKTVWDMENYKESKLDNFFKKL
jgi:hypothetical protein